MHCTASSCLYNHSIAKRNKFKNMYKSSSYFNLVYLHMVAHLRISAPLLWPPVSNNHFMSVYPILSKNDPPSTNPLISTA